MTVILNSPWYGMQIAKAAGSYFYEGVDTCIASERHGVCAGGSVYTSYTGIGGSITMHVASFQPNWITPDLLWTTFYYPFEQLEVRKIIGQVPSHKKDVLAFDLALGFKYETTVKDVFPEGDMIIIGMYKEDAKRWLSIRPRKFVDPRR